MKLDVFNPFLSSIAAIAALLVAPLANAAPIAWNTPTLIAGNTDVLNVGALNYAYNFNNANTTVNGVLFTGTNSTTTIGSNVTLQSGFVSATNTFGAVSGTFNGLTTEYKNLLAGGDYATGAKIITLQNLTSGRVYASQVWVNDSRAGYGGRNETFTSTGGNTVTLDYNNTETTGGVGQYSTGRFVANAATQVMTISGSASPGGTQINAFQVREVTNIGNWVGTGGATWDASTTNNFASNLFSDALVTTNFTAAKATLTSVTFADSYWNSGVATTVTQTAVTVDAAGVSTGKVYFDNSAVNYTISNASGVIGITGSTAIVKNGSGTVTLNGANTYTGITSITGGTLNFNSSDNQTLSGAISGSGTLTKSNTGTLTFSANSSFNGVLNINGGTLEFTNNAAGTHSVFQSTQININNGSTLKVSGAVSGSNIDIYNGRNYTFDSNGGGSILVGQGNYDAATAGFSITTNGGARNNIGVIGGGTSGAFGMNLGNQLGTFNVALGSDATSDLTVTPIIVNSGSILKSGAGRLTFTGVNTYTGTTTIQAGSLIAGANAPSGAAGVFGNTTNALVLGNAITLAGDAPAVLINGAFTVGRAITVGTGAATAYNATIGGSNTSGTSTFSGNITLTNTGTYTTTLQAATGGTVDFTTGTWTNAGNKAIAIGSSGNTGTVKLSNTLSTTGGVSVKFGTLLLGSSNRLGDTTPITVAGGILNVATFTDTVGAVTLTSGSITGTGAGRLTGTSYDVQSGTISAKLGGAGALTKTTAGTVTISSDNSGVGGYTGAVNVNDGKLIVNGNISTSSLTTVALGATLGGSGTVGATVINGTLAVGNSPGIMTFTDTLGLAGSTVMEIDGNAGAGVLVGGHDVVNLTGAGAAGVLTYGGTMTLDMGVVFGVGSYSWDLFTMASETGTFTAITLADQYSGSLINSSGVWDLTSGGNTWQFTESTGILGLTVAAVPEPGAALIGSLGLLALLRRRRN